MKLSIIIVNYNTASLLKKCLESVIRDLCLVASDEKSNTIPNTNHPARLASQREAGRQSPTTEIIVVDNGSTDGSVETIKKLTDSKINGLAIKLIENKENLGFAKAVNQAILQSRSETVLLLNSDTIVKKGGLEKLIEFEKQVRPAIIGLKMFNSDGTVQGSCFRLPTVLRAVKEYWFDKSGYFSKYAPKGDKPVEVEAVSGGAMLISRKIIDEIGLFDERYFMYFEDLDYCRKAGTRGYKIYYFPGSEVIHEHGASGKQLASNDEQWKRLIPSSKIYHGLFKYYLISAVIWSGQKFQKLFSIGKQKNLQFSK